MQLFELDWWTRFIVVQTKIIKRRCFVSPEKLCNDGVGAVCCQNVTAVERSEDLPIYRQRGPCKLE